MSDIVGLNMSASENATINILVPGGHTEAKNGHIVQYKTTAKVAAAREMSIRRGAKAREETQYLIAGGMLMNYPPLTLAVIINCVEC